MMRAKPDKKFEDIYNSVSDMDKRYSLLFGTGWGVYCEFFNDGLELIDFKTPSSKEYMWQSSLTQGWLPKEAFGRKFDKQIKQNRSGQFKLAELPDNKCALICYTGTCREHIQDALWHFMKNASEKLDFTAYKRGKTKDTFWETSAYANKNYKGLSTVKVLNGGIYTKFESKAASKLEKLGETIDNQVKLMDLFVGIPHVLLDRYSDSMKKRANGKKGIAGRYAFADRNDKNTPANYFMYLVPGPTVMKGPFAVSYSVGMMRTINPIIFAGNKPIIDYLSNLVSFKEVREAINKNDFKLARKIFGKIKPIYASFPLNSYYRTMGISRTGHMFDRTMDFYGVSKEREDALLGKKDRSGYRRGGTYIPMAAFEFLVSRGGYPALAKNLKESWNLDTKTFSAHGNTAYGWLLSTCLFAARHIKEFGKFIENYDPDKTNFQ